jgi:hypothetical protein
MRGSRLQRGPFCGSATMRRPAKSGIAARKDAQNSAASYCRRPDWATTTTLKPGRGAGAVPLFFVLLIAFRAAGLLGWGRFFAALSPYSPPRRRGPSRVCGPVTAPCGRPRCTACARRSTRRGRARLGGCNAGRAPFSVWHRRAREHSRVPPAQGPRCRAARHGVAGNPGCRFMKDIACGRSSGRGPIRLISPRNTLTIWGNSSNRTRRRNAPSRVMRSVSTARRGRAPPQSPGAMVRNLHRRKGSAIAAHASGR